MSETVGEILQRLRKERRLNLEHVSTTTHIRLHYLEALESDDLDKLPSEVQGRGFLRMYADYLNIPFQPLLDIWDGKTSQPAQPNVSIDTSPTLPPANPLPPIYITDLAEDPLAKESEFLDDSTNAPQRIVRQSSDPNEIFREIGGILRSQRESLGLALKDIEHYTHVRLHYLKLLEDGKVNELPSLVQARGMLNNYAHFLEVDADVVLLKFADAIQLQFVQRSPNLTHQTVSSKESVPQKARWRRLLTADLAIGGIVILLLLSFTIWAAAQITSTRRTNIEATAPPFSQVISNATDIPPGEGELAATNLPMITQDPNQNQAESSSVPEIGGTLPPGDDGRLQVYVVTRQRAFLRVVVDGEVEFNGRVTPGNAYPFSGNDKIELVTGNAAALQILYNQEDLGTLGSVGQVVHLIFTPDGIITPTPSASLTPTVTTEPTSTVQSTPTLPQPSITPLIP